LQESYSSYR